MSLNIDDTLMSALIDYLDDERKKTFAAFDRLETQNRYILQEMRNIKEENKKLHNKIDELVQQKSILPPTNLRLKRELRSLQETSESTPRKKKAKRAYDGDEKSTPDDSPATFNSLCTDILSKIIGFAGRSYTTVGLINKKCNRTYTKNMIPKETYIFGYGPLSLIGERYANRNRKYFKAKSIIQYNRRDVLDWLIRRQNNDELKLLFSEGARSGRLDILIEVFENSNVVVQSHIRKCLHSCPYAAEKDNLKVLKWLRSRDVQWSWTYSSAAKGGSLEMLKWLNAEGLSVSDKELSLAAERGDMEIMQYLLPENWFDPDRTDYDSSANVCAGAAFGGSLQMAQWLHEQGAEYESDVISSAAAQKGDMAMLKWLETQDCDFTRQTFEAAALSGSVEVLEWLKKKGCRWNEDMMCETAAQEGHLDALKWLRNEGCPVNESTFVHAVLSNNVDVLKFLREEDCPWSEEVTTMASRTKHLKPDNMVNVRRWLRENGCPESPSVAREEIV